MADRKMYLVAVETCPTYDDPTIVVTDDTEGFGPDVLATYPIARKLAEKPQDAAWDYAYEHDLFPLHAFINLPDHSEEWLLSTTGPRQLS